MGMHLLRHYASLNGGSLHNLKTTFCVPPSFDWPAYFHGFRLGLLVNRIRTNGPKYYESNYPNQFKELQSLGFIWDAMAVRRSAILSAFSTFKSIYGHVSINYNFVVPSNHEKWPVITWNMKLGLMAKNIRNYRTNEELHKALRQIGFDYDFQKKTPDFTSIFESLLVFKRLHGHLLVPENFPIHPMDPNYPHSMRGHNFGRLVSHIRRRQYYEQHKDSLDAIGFKFCSKAELKFDLIYQTLQSYKKKYGHLKITNTYIVPKDSLDFPQAAWGMKLGYITRRMEFAKGYQPFLYRIFDLGMTLGGKVSPQSLHYCMDAEYDINI